MGCARHTPLRANVLASLCSEHFLKTCEARGGSDGQSRSRIGASRSECDDQTRLDARVASVAWEAPVPKPLTRRHISKIDETTWDTSGLDATRRGLGPARRKRVVGSSSRAGCGVRSGKWRATDRFPRERARTCMTVSGVRPAGPAPMRISAVAVGETSSGMVVSGRREVEWARGKCVARIYVGFFRMMHILVNTLC